MVLEKTTYWLKGSCNGTLAMLSEIDFLPSEKVLDSGCGYGVVSILAGKFIGEESVIMCDISEQKRFCVNTNGNRLDVW